MKTRKKFCIIVCLIYYIMSCFLLWFYFNPESTGIKEWDNVQKLLLIVVTSISVTASMLFGYCADKKIEINQEEISE